MIPWSWATAAQTVQLVKFSGTPTVGSYTKSFTTLLYQKAATGLGFIPVMAKINKGETFGVFGGRGSASMRTYSSSGSTYYIKSSIGGQAVTLNRLVAWCFTRPRGRCYWGNLQQLALQAAELGP